MPEPVEPDLDLLSRSIRADLMGLQVFPAILDEFGSTLNNTDEIACMQSIATYANAQTAPSDSTTHAPLKSWFFW